MLKYIIWFFPRFPSPLINPAVGCHHFPQTMVTFPTPQHHCLLALAKLYCLVILVLTTCPESLHECETAGRDQTASQTP